ncbi:hypothetical protein PHMEG_00039947 [Phytophthora megakarya]|uniref:TIR domain-containing protein n=1 Tax=Phytophthora megakarya TaxID=4795 RepID=A0A225UEI1_9STRA|nr:hypothetical protein PHMEG_00039947 [Phytophthora megakarya]
MTRGHASLDGIRDEIEKHRYVTKQRNLACSRQLARSTDDLSEERSHRSTVLRMLNDAQISTTIVSWDPNTTNVTSPNSLEEGRFVFISHGDNHAEFVQQFTSQLMEAGVPCYSDQSVSEHDFYSRIQIAQKTIQRCSCFIVLLSKQTMTSELVRDQLAFAEDKGRPIFPLVLNDLNPGLDKRYTLVRSDLFHFMTNGMGFKTSFDMLISALQLHCDFDVHNSHVNHKK